MTWHVTTELATEYAAGSLPEPQSWSVEKHVESCTACAAAVSVIVASGAAGPGLAAIRAELMGVARAPVPVSRPLPATASRVAWAAGPAIRVPWLIALLIVAGAAVAAARLTGYDDARPLLLALAPVLPLLGVAVSYGPYADPMHELAAATPSGGLRLLLVRTAVVLATALPVVMLAGVLLPVAPGCPGPVTWLLPCLALILGALALGSYTGCRIACTLLGGGWLFAVAALTTEQAIGPPRPGQALAGALAALTSTPAAQAGWAVTAALGAGLLTARRTTFDRLPFHHLERM